MQLQNRFEEATGREMSSRDYAAWAAVRTIGEAVTRTNSADPTVLRAFILSDKFALDGFKGRSLSYRSWNGQLRQPMPVVMPASVLSRHRRQAAFITQVRDKVLDVGREAIRRVARRLDQTPQEAEPGGGRLNEQLS